MKILEFILASTLNFAWRRRRIWSNSTSLGVIFPCGGGVLVAISCIFERRRARFSYFQKSDDDGQKIRKPGMPDYGNVSPRQTTKEHVLYVPGVNLQLITQERDHKDPSQITAPCDAGDSGRRRLAHGGLFVQGFAGICRDLQGSAGI